MKAKTFVVAMIMPLVAMTFQSCPGQMIPVPETDMYAYVYNPDDSIYVRFYTRKDDQLQKHEMSIEFNGIVEICPITMSRITAKIMICIYAKSTRMRWYMCYAVAL